MSTLGENGLTADGSSHFLETSEHRIHYHDAGSGHPIIMLHGSGPGATGWSNFSSNIEPLSADFRALAIDMPGWGKSEPLTADAGVDHVKILLEIIDKLELEKVALIGNSMGGMTSIRFSVEHADRVSHLIPMGAPAPGTNVFTPGGGVSEGLKVLLDTFQDPSPANFKRLVSIMAYDPKYATDELAAERSKNALEDPEKLTSFTKLQAGGGMAAFFSLANRLHEIAAPTLVVHGRDDRTVSFENGLRLLSAIPNSRALIFNQCGHWAQLEHADEFNRVVAQFITNS